MKKITGLLIFSLLWSAPLVAQVIIEDPPPATPSSGGRLHQIYLKEPAKSIDLLENEKTCEPIKGRLSPDGKSIYIDEYPEKTTVRARVTYENGKSDEFVRSPCYIDPVL